MSEILNLAQEIAGFLARKIDEIDLIYLFGGLAQGREHPRSDIEMVAVSKEKLFRWEFILGERPIFIWPKSWEQLEQSSTGRYGYWSVACASIAHAKILYYKTDENRKHFAWIQNQSRLVSQNALRRSINSFDTLYGKLWRIQKSIETGRKKDTTFLIWDLIKK